MIDTAGQYRRHSIDLPLLLAIVSSYRNRLQTTTTVFLAMFGEMGLIWRNKAGTKWSRTIK